MNESSLNTIILEFKALIECLPARSRQNTFTLMMLYGQYLDLHDPKDTCIWEQNCTLLEAELIKPHEDPVLNHALYAFLVILKTDVQITFKKSSLDITETLELLKKKWRDYLAAITYAPSDATNKMISSLLKKVSLIYSEVQKKLLLLQKEYAENKKSVDVFQTVEYVEPVKTKPKKNKKNNTKKIKPVVKKIQVEEISVCKWSRERKIPPHPERKVTLFSPPEVFPRRAVLCVSLETTLKHLQKEHPTVFYRIKPRTLIKPVQDILDLFNSNANLFNNEKYRAAKTGSSVFGETKANDTDITVNCSLEEAHKLLACVRGIQEITRIEGDFPILHITLTDYPHHPVEISALENATQKPYLVLLNEKLSKSDYHPTSCAYLSFKKAVYIIDPNEGLKHLKEDKEKGMTPKLRLTKHEHTPKNSSLIALRGIKFLATHHDFTPDEAFCSWLKENNHHLKHPGAIHPFVKLLLSGIAYDGLVKMKKHGLLQIIFPDLVEPLETSSAFIERVKFFDQYSAQACRLAARENYWETVTKTLTFLFDPLKILPPKLDEATKTKIYSHWNNTLPNATQPFIKQF